MKITVKQLKKLIKESFDDDAQAIYGDVLTVGSFIKVLQGFDPNAVVLVDAYSEQVVMQEHDLRKSEDGYVDATTGNEILDPCVIITTWS